MNFYVLVEGRRDEPRVYTEWLKQCFPSMSQVKLLDQVEANHFVIFAGHGQPSITNRIKSSIELIADRGNIDRFFLCLDAEECTYDECFREAQHDVRKAMVEAKIQERVPGFREYIIVQNVCLETWFLGNVSLVDEKCAHVMVKPLLDTYDVRALDPEELPLNPRYTSRARFHKHYLKQVLHAHKRSFPGVAQDPTYTQALRDRCSATNHLRSLQRLFDVLDNP